METQPSAQDATNLPLRITVGVFRRLDNRFEGLPDQSPRGRELHNRRKEALHEVFDGEKTVEIIDWGQTNDTRSHEYVELLIGIATAPAFRYLVVPGLKFIGQKLAEKAVDETTSELVKAVVSWLRGPQQEKKILDFSVTLPDNTKISIDPPDRYATITIEFAKGKVESINYKQSPEPQPQPLAPTA